ncbi:MULTISPECIES: preprotein translocase subunit YajC [Rhodospirillales]|uniref:Sec translocon accessory complex subunit YajC n=2 Tax=Rhodospirillales TaxID=204441 RepID=B6ISM8_RHOCS|nr:preprotein translocase subunit YajC [Rhodospirillum centenum]ACI98464.1 preprotein translocase subunit YajC, putative [Rhodospirillum centenum SW]
MFISTAFAQGAGAPAEPNALVSLLPLILIFVVFYFLLIRPQQKKMKEHKAMLEALRRGDRVVTGGGIVGTVVKVGPDDELTVEIAEGVRVRVIRGTVSAVLAKTEPAKAKADSKADDAADAAAKK